MVAVERVLEYSQIAEIEPQDDNLPQDFVLDGSFEFRNFSMRYRPGVPLSLRNVSFAVRAGEHVGMFL